MGFDDIDRSFNKKETPTKGPTWFTLTDDVSCVGDTVEELMHECNCDTAEVIEISECVVKRDRFAVTMRLVEDEDDYETRVFDSRAEAVAWRDERDKEAEAYDNREEGEG